MDWSTKISVFFNTMKNEYWQELFLTGLLNTVKIAVIGLILGIVVGVLIAIVKVAPKY